jgi:hypothetical protein
MFNSPILDIIIGLVFIFLLYSLLATSIKEAIATGLGLRARMLKKGIINGMLTATTEKTKWKSIGDWWIKFLRAIVHLFAGRPILTDDQKKIGDYFYDHPVIKNYGSGQIYKYPSYIPTGSFSTVMIDVLKKDFESKKTDIADFKKLLNPDAAATILTDLESASTPIQISELLQYYRAFYDPTSKPRPKIEDKNLNIDKETLRILLLHFQTSQYSVEQFGKKLEGWFDESMERVSGWYKRQVQYILFVIGLALAFSFNVNTIAIGRKLATDKKVRDALVENAIAYSKSSQKNNASAGPDSAKVKYEEVNKNLQAVDSNINSLLGLGWANYNGPDCFCSKAAFIWNQISGESLVGYLILAIAVSLGAPFWFDMLSKLVNLRGTGKKTNTDNDSTAKTAVTATPATNTTSQPVNVNINNQNQEEAVG